MVTRAWQRIEVTRAPSEIHFLVSELLYFESRKLCAMAGHIVSGTIKPGMSLHVPTGSNPPVKMRIDSIEFLLKRSSNEELVCLTHKCKRKMFNRLESYGIVGQTLEITLEGSN
jgi:hypothetical protein